MKELNLSLSTEQEFLLAKFSLEIDSCNDIETLRKLLKDSIKMQIVFKNVAVSALKK